MKIKAIGVYKHNKLHIWERWDLREIQTAQSYCAYADVGVDKELADCIDWSKFVGLWAMPMPGWNN